MAKFKALGTSLQYATVGAPTVFTTVAQLQTIEGPGGDTEEIDVTTHDSTGGFRENLASFKDGGEVTMTGIWDPPAATHDATTGIASMYASGTTVNWKIVLTDTGLSVVTFQGWIKSFRTNETYDDALRFSATVRVTGAITFPA